MTFPPVPTLTPLETPGFPAPGNGLSSKRPSPLDMMGVMARPKEGASNPGEPASDRQHEQLVRSTQQWVAQAFFGTLMKQMRESPFKSDLFEGGRGGQAFTSMYDQKLVEQMSRGAGNKLVNAIVHSIEKNMRKAQAGAAYDKQKGSAAATEKPREVDAVSRPAPALPADARRLDRAVGEARRSSFNHVRADVPAAFRS
jgi:Rod binding domain-containing protein